MNPWTSQLSSNYIMKSQIASVENKYMSQVIMRPRPCLTITYAE